MSNYQVTIEAPGAINVAAAAASAVAADASADAAAISATAAGSSQTAAEGSATTASTAATTAAGAASTATAQASIATTKAAEAAASEMASGNNATSAAASAAAAGVASGRLVVASFFEIATKFVYSSPGAGQQIVAAGDIITVLAADTAYRVALSSATDAITQGAAKIYALDRKGFFARNEVDVFLIYGQSNAQGQPASSTGALSWIAATAEMWTGSALAPLSNAMPVPVGGTFTGSAWPAFANEYFERTGRRAVYVNVARGSQSIADLSKPGANYTNMLDWVTDAKDAIVARGDTVGRICVLFVGGEQDQVLGTSYEVHRSALDQLWSDLKADTGATHLAIWPLGRYTSASVRSAWAIQEAQLAFAKTEPDAFIAYDGVMGFSPENGLSDGVHYTMPGYNLMGREGAKTVAAILFDNGTEGAEAPRLHGQLRYSSFQRQSRAAAVIAKSAGGPFDWVNTRGGSGSFIRSIDAATDANQLRLMLSMPAQQYLEFSSEAEKAGQERGLIPCVQVITDADSLADDYIGVSFVMRNVPLRVNLSTGAIDASALGTAYNTMVTAVVTATFPSTGNCTLTHPAIIGVATGSIRGDTARQLRVNSSSTTTSVRVRDGAGTLVNDEVAIILPAIIIPHANIPTGYTFSVGVTFNGYGE